jgi:death-on-curing protein
VTRYITLGEYLWLGEQVTGVEAVVLAKAARTELADSALHAPQAAFDGHEFYVEVVDKAAVLVCRLSWNHPLPDGNKRAAWPALVLFLDLNGARRDGPHCGVDEWDRASDSGQACRVGRTRDRLGARRQPR